MVREVSRRLRENDEMAIEDLRLKARELAEAYQKLAEIELARQEFLTTIAHELRTPLTSANGFLHMIKMGIVQDDALEEALSTVSKNLQRIIGLMNDILFLQEVDLILSEFEPVNLFELLQKLIDAEKIHADKMGVEFILATVGDVPFVSGDQKSLSRAFGAFINNAVKFSLNGGQVEINIEDDNNTIWVSISDEGIGIPEKNFNKIFDRFWRTEVYQGHLFDGVGLGLPIAKQVIDQHGGTIEINSPGNKGAKFRIGLPRPPLP
jgi:signal transduction histidine kinase